MSDGYFQPGAVVGGHYQIIRLLGSGSAGLVYLCRHLELDGLEMALKVLSLSSLRRSSSSDNVVSHTRFRHELTATYRVKNPYVVRPYEYLAETDCLAYTMEYVSGGDLEHLIASSAPLPLANVAELLMQACEGVQAIHDAGIIHRDLKPANILLTEDAQVKITDFGIARMPDMPRITATGNCLGTVPYLSPEYLQEGTVSISGDVYALGTIAFEMITNQLPFDGGGVYHSVEGKIRSEAPLVTEYRKDCPADLVSLVQKALNRDPEKRFQSAMAMKHDLEQIFTAYQYADKVEQLAIRKEQTLQSAPPLADMVREAASEHGRKAIEIIVNPYVEDEHHSKDKSPAKSSMLGVLLKQPKQGNSSAASSGISISLLSTFTTLFCALGILVLVGIVGPFQSEDAHFAGEQAEAAINPLPQEPAAQTLEPEVQVDPEASRTEYSELINQSIRARLGALGSRELEQNKTPSTQENIMLAALGSKEVNTSHYRTDAAHSLVSDNFALQTVVSAEKTKKQVIDIQEKQILAPKVESSAAKPVEIKTTKTLNQKKLEPKTKQKVVLASAAKQTPASSSLGQKKISSTQKQSKVARVQLAFARRTSPKRDLPQVKQPQLKTTNKTTVKISLPLKVRATLLYRFADYVEWPTGSFSARNTPIQICVLGQDPLGAFLEQTVLKNKSRNQRSFSVRTFSKLPAKSMLGSCHIVYLSRSKSLKAPQVERAIRGKGVLLVTENTGSGVIDFIVANRKVKFVIDTSRAKSSGIKIAQLLLDIALEVCT